MAFQRLLVICALQAIAPVLADDDELPGVSPAEHQWIDSIDTDGNGIIDRHELRSFGFHKNKKMRTYLDVNGDGHVSKAELGAAVVALKVPKVGGDSQLSGPALVTKRRTEKDAQDEYPKARKFFDRMDTNHDGNLSGQELAAFGFGHKSILRSLDANDDKVLSQSEFDKAVAISIGLPANQAAAQKRARKHSRNDHHHHHHSEKKEGQLLETQVEHNSELPPQGSDESNYCYRLRTLCKAGRPGRCSRYCQQCYEGQYWDSEERVYPWARRYYGGRRGYGLLEVKASEATNDMAGICGGQQPGWVEDFVGAVTSTEAPEAVPEVDRHLNGWKDWYSNQYR